MTAARRSAGGRPGEGKESPGERREERGPSIPEPRPGTRDANETAGRAARPGGARGRPGGLQRVEVRRPGQGHYRVNVFVAAGAGAVRIAHSYFLVADGEGRVTAPTPNLAGRY
jgi:hypothetical protein